MNLLKSILIFLIAFDCFAATGDVIIDTRSASGLRVANNLTPSANMVIGFDAGGNLVVKAGGSASITWADITGKPATFTPSAHNQAWSTITDRPTTLAGYGITDSITAAAVATGYQPLATVLTNTTASFTTTLLSKLDGIAAGAEVNVNADWLATSGDAQILNKPVLGTMAAETASNYLTTAAAVAGYQPLATVLTNTTASFTTTLLSKLDGITGTNTGDISITDTDTIDHTLTGQALSSAARLQMSLTSDASGIRLVGDAATPGNNKVYGTNGSGTKGWYDAVSGGGTGDMTKAAYDSTDSGFISGLPGANGEAAGGDGGKLKLTGGAGHPTNGAHTGGLGGTIEMIGGNGDDVAVGGAAGSITTSGFDRFTGGFIDTSANTAPGGSIDTSNGGGSINTRGTGSIGFGLSGTRTTVTGTATANRAISLPNADGTLALTSQLHSAVSVSDSDTIDHTLTGQSLNSVARLQMSLTSDASGIRLVGDAGTPGNNKVYGTNASGSKGWYDAGSGSGTVTSVGGTGTVNGLTLTGTVTSSGNLTLGGTLSGVSLTTAVSGTLPIANGGTGQTTAVAAFDALAPTTTKGDLIVHNGTDNIRVPVGATNGHVLTVDSAEASGVKWAAGGGGSSGAMVLLASATASGSAEILFDNEFDSALYSSYVLEIIGVQPATDNVALRVQLRNSTPANITSDYRSNLLIARIDAAGLLNVVNSVMTTGWQLQGDLGNAANELGTWTIKIFPIAGQWTHMTSLGYLTNFSTERYSTQGAGACQGTTAPAGVRIYMASGNISIGAFQLYGILK